MGEKEERSTAIHIFVPSYFKTKVRKQKDISHEQPSNLIHFLKKNYKILKQFLSTLKTKVIEFWIFRYHPLDQGLVKDGLKDLTCHWFRELSLTGIPIH